MPKCTRDCSRTSIGEDFESPRGEPVEELEVLDDAIVTEDEDSINVDLDGDGEVDVEIPK